VKGRAPGLAISSNSALPLPAVFLPAGRGKRTWRNGEIPRYPTISSRHGESGRDALMAAKWQPIHGPTCTFYRTSNTNQMLMEFT